MTTVGDMLPSEPDARRWFVLELDGWLAGDESRLQVGSWLDDLWTSWLGDTRSFDAAGSDRGLAVTPGAAPKLSIGTTNNGRAWNPQPTADNWREVLHRLALGQLDFISVSMEISLLGARAVTAANCHCSFEVEREGPFMQMFRVTSSDAAGLTQEVQQQAIWRWLALASIVRPKTGHVTLDIAEAAGSMTAHELTTGHGWIDMPNLATHVRGYHWGTYLSDGHIERLGGLDLIYRNAPVAKAVDLSDRQGKRVYLQLTDDVRIVSADQLRALKAYLDPLLVPTAGNFSPRARRARIV